MSASKASLNEIAEVIKVHPRTILRALRGHENVYWAVTHNPDIDLIDVALTFELEMADLDRLMAGKDVLFKPIEAADYLSATYDHLPLRTFRYRNYPAIIRHGGIVRYSRKHLADYHVRNHVRD